MKKIRNPEKFHKTKKKLLALQNFILRWITIGYAFGYREIKNI